MIVKSELLTKLAQKKITPEGLAKDVSSDKALFPDALGGLSAKEPRVK